MNSPADDPLDPVWASYQITRRLLSIARDAIRLGSEPEIGFGQLAYDTNTSATAMKEIGNYAVVSLWAAFERFVIEYVTDSGQALKNRAPEGYHTRLCEHLDREIERWRSDELLDLFKDVVGTELIGEAKQIKRYRDFLAHRNPRRAPAGVATPENVHLCLSSIIRTIQQATPATA